MNTVLVDYGAGNLHSAAKAFQRVAARTGAGTVTVSAEPEAIARADRVVLPGDGAFPHCRAQLYGRAGLVEALEEAVRRRGRPFLGICIGMQMLASRGLEYSPTPGLDWIAGEVRRVAPSDPGLKVPHMGWNELVLDRPHPVLAGLRPGAHAYFVHSWQLVPADPADGLAHCDHGGPITAAVGRDTVLGVQFHPEKSQATGLRLIADFLAWRP